MITKKALINKERGILIQFDSPQEYEAAINALHDAETTETMKKFMKIFIARYDAKESASYILEKEMDRLFVTLINVLAVKSNEIVTLKKESSAHLNSLSEENEMLRRNLEVCCEITERLTSDIEEGLIL